MANIIDGVESFLKGFCEDCFAAGFCIGTAAGLIVGLLVYRWVRD
jgi:hypothetical protein